MLGRDVVEWPQKNIFFLIPREQKNKDQLKEVNIKTASTSSFSSHVKGRNESTDTSVAALGGQIREEWMRSRAGRVKCPNSGFRDNTCYRRRPRYPDAVDNDDDDARPDKSEQYLQNQCSGCTV